MRGKKLKACGMGKSSSHGALRATSSRVREAVFNIAGQDMTDMIFVDLYAGTGTMGMEAMSRGARRVIFVESDPQRSRLLRETLDDCGCRAKAEILNITASDFMIFLTETGGRADVFYMDPPYDSDELESVLPLIARSGALNEDGIVLAEHGSSRVLPETVETLIKSKKYKYGDTVISLYRIGHE